MEYPLNEIREMAIQTIGQIKCQKFLQIRPGLLSSTLFFNVYINAKAILRTPNHKWAMHWLEHYSIAMFNYEKLDNHSLQYGSHH